MSTNTSSELAKQFNSVTVELYRSEIKPATYNPRTISEKARKELKRSIRRFGIVGGLVVNVQTGNTLVSGHQKVSILDEINKYDDQTNDNDYKLKVEQIDVDEKTEKELNIMFNNPNAMGSWDYDALRELIPDIDYQNAGLTDQDLNLMGVQLEVETALEETSNILGDIERLQQPVQQKKEAEKEAKKEAIKAAKQSIRDNVDERFEDGDPYFMMSFDSYKNKAAFMQRFGFDNDMKFVKGEVFSEMIERVE